MNWNCAFNKEILPYYLIRSFDYPGFGFRKSINETYTYNELFELSKKIDTYFDGVVNKILDLSKDVTPAKKPE